MPLRGLRDAPAWLRLSSWLKRSRSLPGPATLTLMPILLLMLMLPLSAAHAAPTVTLKVAAQEGTEPKFIAAGDGRIVGICIDLFRAIERIDPGLIFIGDQHWLPLVRAHSELATHQHDALCAVQRSPERERQYAFLDQPIFTLQYVLLVRANDNVVVHDWNDVRKLGAQGVVLVNRGYTVAETLDRLGGLQVNSSATNPAMNLQKLVAGRGRFFLHRGPGLSGFITRAGFDGKVKILPQVMYSTDVFMAMGTHIDPGVRLRVQHALEQLDRNGELARMLKKWD
jgi:polar amino acid transport system substrate-binding protein